jgi:hypothetical protein
MALCVADDEDHRTRCHSRAPSVHSVTARSDQSDTRQIAARPRWVCGRTASCPEIACEEDSDSTILVAEGDYVVGRWAGGGTHTVGEEDALEALQQLGLVPEK